jgi:hypothetical protein
MAKTDCEVRRYERPRLRYGPQRAVPRPVPGRSLPAGRRPTTCRQPTDTARVYRGDDAAADLGKGSDPRRSDRGRRGIVRRFSVLEDGPPAWDQLMELTGRYSFGGRQVHDANVVATMLAHGELCICETPHIHSNRANAYLDRLSRAARLERGSVLSPAATNTAGPEMMLIIAVQSMKYIYTAGALLHLSTSSGLAPEPI